MAVSATTTPLVMIYSVFLFIFLLNPSFSVAKSKRILYSGETLSSGDSLTYRTYTFEMQKWCNLNLYDGPDLLWSSRTQTGLVKNCSCSLQNDGNLVMQKPDGAPLWSSNTHREQGYYVLILQEDNVVIYGGAIWHTNTNSGNSILGGGGTMNVDSIKNLPAPIIYSDGAH